MSRVLGKPNQEIFTTSLGMAWVSKLDMLGRLTLRCVDTYIYISLSLSVYIYIFICSCMCIYIYMFIHIYICT